MFVVLYLSAIVLANLSVALFGPQVVVLNAFLFIGLDLTARDRLHDAWRGRALLPKMAALIAAGSLISWLLNRAAGPIALASFAAFAAAASVDTAVYHLLGGYPRWLRINGSNVPSAAVDSLVFPTLAFGRFLWPIILGQFAAKVMGGLAWSFILLRLLPGDSPEHTEPSRLWRPLELLAGAFLNWRTLVNARAHGLDPAVISAATTPNGTSLRLALEGISIIADEAADLLRDFNATNYVEMEMVPRADRGNRKIVITVRWKDGETPGQRAARLALEVDGLSAGLEAALAELEDLRAFDGQAA